MTNSEEVVATLGGVEALGRQIESTDDLIGLVRSGLPFAAFNEVCNQLSLPTETLGSILGLSADALADRRQAGILQADESDRLYRVARIAARAFATFGSHEKARQWLHRPNRALVGQTPFSLLDTDLGVGRIDEVLGRIEHGVFS